jgi:hypothetical protein
MFEQQWELRMTETFALQNAAAYDFHSFLSMFLVKRIHRETRAVLIVSPDRLGESHLPESAVLQIFACVEAMSRFWHLLKARSGSYNNSRDIMVAYRGQLMKWASEYSQMFWKWKWFDLVFRVMEDAGRLLTDKAFPMVLLEELSPMECHLERLLHIGDGIWPEHEDARRSGVVGKFPILMWENGSFCNWTPLVPDVNPRV